MLLVGIGYLVLDNNCMAEYALQGQGEFGEHAFETVLAVRLPVQVVIGAGLYYEHLLVLSHISRMLLRRRFWLCVYS